MLTTMVYHFCVLLALFPNPTEMCKQIIKPEYQPYGPVMCKDVCGCSPTIPQYTKTSLSCRCLPKGNTPPDEPTKLTTSNKKPFSSPPIIQKKIPQSISGNRFKYSPSSKECKEKPSTTPEQLPKCSPLLIQACTENSAVLIKRYVNSTIDVNCKISYRYSLVMFAVCNGKSKAFISLAKLGANLCLVSDVRDSLVHLAVKSGVSQMLKDVLDKGSFDINMKNSKGFCPLALAASLGLSHAFDYLRKSGAEVNVVDETKNYNILHFACAYSNYAMVKHILDLKISGLDIDAKDNEGFTPVMLAVNKCKKKVVQVFINARYVLSNSVMSRLRIQCRFLGIRF